ncbi:MAG TPA: hypothetical protein VF552_01800 [Allosphingosinicella sp.]|jgi:hypothetical protein
MIAMLAFYVVMTIFSFGLFLRPEREAQRVKARMESGEDRFFEERRAYRAYPSLRVPRRIRIGGAVGTLLGIALCVMEIVRG